jgi:hypothetical protein
LLKFLSGLLKDPGTLFFGWIVRNLSWWSSHHIFL